MATQAMEELSAMSAAEAQDQTNNQRCVFNILIKPYVYDVGYVDCSSAVGEICKSKDCNYLS